MKANLIPLAVLAAVLTLSGCSRYWNEEAGAYLDQGDFGNATMNNQLAMTCRKLTSYNVEKYGSPIRSNCPGRTHDGKYAMFAYQETIQSATEVPPTIIRAAHVVR